MNKFETCPNVPDHDCLKCLNRLVTSINVYQHTKNQLYTFTIFLFWNVTDSSFEILWKCLGMLHHGYLTCLNHLVHFTDAHPLKKLPSRVNSFLIYWIFKNTGILLFTSIPDMSDHIYLKCLNHNPVNIECSKPEGCDWFYC